MRFVNESRQELEVFREVDGVTFTLDNHDNGVAVRFPFEIVAEITQLLLKFLPRKSALQEFHPVAENIELKTRATVMAMIQSIETEAKNIKPDDTTSLKCLAMSLEVISAYEEWLQAFKVEINKLNKINQQQAHALRNKAVMKYT